jgi:hypothetical protein
MLWPDDFGWRQDIGGLAILDGNRLLDAGERFRIDHVRTVIEARLHLVPRYRQLLHFPRRGLGWPLWVDAPRFDLADHVRVFPVPAPGDEAQLLQIVEQLRRRQLDRSRPLWQMWFLPGLPRERVAFFLKMHHTIADGVAGVATLGALTDTRMDTGAGTVGARTPGRQPPGTIGRFRSHCVRVRSSGGHDGSRSGCMASAARDVRGGMGSAEQPQPSDRLGPQARRRPQSPGRRQTSCAHARRDDQRRAHDRDRRRLPRSIAMPRRARRRARATRLCSRVAAPEAESWRAHGCDDGDACLPPRHMAGQSPDRRRSVDQAARSKT